MATNKVHLVCSSGGVKCFSYLGAVQKLIDNNITIASVSACSMGSVLGALICSGMEISKIEQFVLDFDFKLLQTRKWFYKLKALRKYPFATSKTPDFEKIIISLLGSDMKIGDMVIPLSIAALDMKQKRFLVYSSETHPDMKLSEIIQIATAIPFIYEPFKLKRRVLVDAAVASHSPIWIAANNPGFYPIVVLKPEGAPISDTFKKDFGAYLSAVIDASSVSHDHFMLTQTKRVLEIPINCGNISLLHFKMKPSEIENLIIQGQLAVEQKLIAFNYNFNKVLEIENSVAVSDISKDSDLENQNNEMSPNANKAAQLANKIINDYQNEPYKRNQVFVSYSHKDKQWLDKFSASLRSIERFTGIKMWDDTEIQTGDIWNREIKKALISTKVAVFLVTPNFLASNFIQDKEMGYFLEISEKEQVPIVWVACTSSLYEITPLKDIQCANSTTAPLDTLSEAEQNAEITRICKDITRLMAAQNTNS